MHLHMIKRPNFFTIKYYFIFFMLLLSRINKFTTNNTVKWWEATWRRGWLHHVGCSVAHIVQCRCQ
jgi:hypothetical protein